MRPIKIDNGWNYAHAQDMRMRKILMFISSARVKIQLNI